MNARIAVSFVHLVCAVLVGCSSTPDAGNVAGSIATEGSAEPSRDGRTTVTGPQQSPESSPVEDANPGMVSDSFMISAEHDDPVSPAGGAEASAPGSCKGLFCEDFELGKIDPAVWNVQANGGQTVEVQKSVVAHGQYAVKFHALPNIVSYDFIITKSAPSSLRGHHFGRAYFQVAPKPPQLHTEFLFAGTSGFPNLKYLEVAENDLGFQLTFVSRVTPTGEKYAFGGKIPLAGWTCLEWEMNDTPDQITVFVEGVRDSSFTNIDFNGITTGLVGGFVDFGFGFYAWHPATYAFDVYYDDIVLDTKRVDCL